METNKKNHLPFPSGAKQRERNTHNPRSICSGILDCGVFKRFPLKNHPEFLAFTPIGLIRTAHTDTALSGAWGLRAREPKWGLSAVFSLSLFFPAYSKWFCIACQLRPSSFSPFLLLAHGTACGWRSLSVTLFATSNDFEQFAAIFAIAQFSVCVRVCVLFFFLPLFRSLPCLHTARAERNGPEILKHILRRFLHIVVFFARSFSPPGFPPKLRVERVRSGFFLLLVQFQTAVLHTFFLHPT